MVDQETFQTLLKNLSPQTLAQIVADLEQAQEDWEYYPGQAPTEEMQHTLLGVLSVIQSQGQTLAGQEGLDFAELLERARTEQANEDWAGTRDEQEVQNWMSDFD